MQCIGITGGIGAGKTIIASVFNYLGAPVFNADEAGKNALVQENIISEIRKHFGEKMLHSNGNINTTLLADIVFADKNQLHLLTNITHPFIKEKFQEWKDKQTYNYVILDAAILLESELLKNIADIIIYIESPIELRLQRVMARNQWTKEHIIQRMQMQKHYTELNIQPHYIIQNDNTKLLFPQLLKIHEAYM